MDRPQLRRTVTGQVDAENSKFVVLYDQTRLTPGMIRLPRDLIPVLELFDGQRTVEEIRDELMRDLGGQLVPREFVDRLVTACDEACLLDSPRFREQLRERIDAPIRLPSCIGCYSGERDQLREQLDAQFTRSGAPGALPGRNGTSKSNLRGALIPHIDYHRGGHTYAWGYKELSEHGQADTFVILGTSHYSEQRFTLTRQDFETPLGVTKTDQAYVDCLANHYGESAFRDPAAHLPEHSIELQVVFLQHLFGDRPFKIVPILVGSFHDCVQQRLEPAQQVDIARMVEALKKTEDALQRKVFYLSSGDLAHIGPKFDDPKPVHEAQLKHCQTQDLELLKRAETGRPEQLFEFIHAEADERRTCGFPPTYTLLAALEPSHGKLLHYDRYVDPRGYESVSFASLAFYK